MQCHTSKVDEKISHSCPLTDSHTHTHTQGDSKSELCSSLKISISVGGSRKMSRHGHTIAEITKIAKTCLKLVQMTSYLDTNKISRKETFPESLVKIRRRDVTWRHMTSFRDFWVKICWKSADVSKIVNRLGSEMLFPEKSYILPFQRWVNQLYTISGSKFIVGLAQHVFSAKKCWRHY